jgi:hypothetical protein
MSKEYIVLHHSAGVDHPTLPDFDSIRNYHMKTRGYRDIGYHWVVEKVRNVLVAKKGRPEKDDAAACPGMNTRAIHICCVGNFMVETPTPELYRFVAGLCKDIATRWPIKYIGGHRDYYATACPGQKFDVEMVRKYFKEGNSVGKEKTPCIIDIKGKKFPGYLQGAISYFEEGVSVREVVEAIQPSINWDSKTMTVEIK